MFIGLHISFHLWLDSPEQCLRCKTESLHKSGMDCAFFTGSGRRWVNTTTCRAQPGGVVVQKYQGGAEGAERGGSSHWQAIVCCHLHLQNSHSKFHAVGQALSLGRCLASRRWLLSQGINPAKVSDRTILFIYFSKLRRLERSSLCIWVQFTDLFGRRETDTEPISPLRHSSSAEGGMPCLAILEIKIFISFLFAFKVLFLCKLSVVSV